MSKSVKYMKIIRETQGDIFHQLPLGLKNIFQSQLKSSAEDLYWIDSIEEEDFSKKPANRQGIGNLHRINDVQFINKYFEEANRTLAVGEPFLICLETLSSRRVRILNKFPKVISVPYYALDFILKRAFPKWKSTKKIYFWLTKGRNRVLSLPEILGRLSSCGFSIDGHQRVGYLTYVFATKKSEPAYDMNATYDLLIRLKRIGKDGKLFRVYKFRTMYPYSEYLQEYAYNQNQLQEGGKIRDDFRVTEWGRWFRKLWIDELPMLINFMKGEMKIVGVRPLSRHYFQLYPKEMQELRTKVKPGLVPPFYADLPVTFEEILESEKQYIHSYMKSPLKTDLIYFFKAMHNILIKKARSN